MKVNHSKTISLVIFLVLLLLILPFFGIPKYNKKNSLNEFGAEEKNSSEPWWERWMYDKNHNKIDDRIEEKMTSAPHTPIPIFVDYAFPPSEKEKKEIENLGFEVNYIAKSVDTIFVNSILPREVPRLLSLPGIVMIELDPPIYKLLDVSSPAVKARGSPYYSPNTAWDMGYTGKDVVIAVLDTGVDDIHESLNGKFVAGVDVSNPAVDINGNPDDGNGHGTHVAGIAIGNGGNTDNNGDGEPDYMGTAPDALLVDVKIGTDVGGNVGSSIIRGIDWCIEHKEDYNISILSISFGTTSKSDGQDATSRSANQAVDNGFVVVVAAGNDGDQGFGSPAAADKVITIGAVDDKATISRKDDTIADYSNRGPRDDDGDDDPYDELKPDVVAPGTDIMSCRYSEIGQAGVGYVEMTGTSMACPHVSGIVALMLEANPNLTPDKIKKILRESAEQRGVPYDKNLSKRYSTEYGWGIVDAYNAVKLALRGEFPTNIDVTIETPADGEEVSNETYINASVEINQGSVETIELFINNKSVAKEENTDHISYLWNTRKVRNGEYLINVTATGGNATASAEIRVFVNNTGEAAQEEEENGLLTFEFLPYAGGVALTLIFIIVGAVFMKRRKEKKKRNICKKCGGELSYIKEYDAWYCYQCEEYA